MLDTTMRKQTQITRAREGLAVPASYTTPDVLQSSQINLLAVIEERNIYVKRKIPLSFNIWIFRNVQQDCDDDRMIFVAMTAT